MFYIVILVQRKNFRLKLIKNSTETRKLELHVLFFGRNCTGMFLKWVLKKYSKILVWVIMLHKLWWENKLCGKTSYLLPLRMKSWPLESISSMSSKLSKYVLGKVMSLQCHFVILSNTHDLFICSLRIVTIKNAFLKPSLLVGIWKYK